MSELITVARPYARAAFEFADERHAVAEWEQQLNFIAQVSCDKRVQELLSLHPKPSEQATLLITVCGEDNVDQYGQNFIRLLAENQRLTLLPTIIELFARYVADNNAIVDVKVVSATLLTPEQSDAIKMAMEKRLNQKVKLTHQVDLTLIAGFIVYYGDMVIDKSVKARLASLANVLRS